MAWFSDRGGNSDIYLTTTPNGKDWRTPVRVTTSPEGDFYPNLLQDDQGFFHLTWFRWDAPFHGNIWYNSSSDGVTWDQRNAVQVTTAADVDDWVPTITQAADGTLLIYFVSQLRDGTNPTSDIYVSAKRPTEDNWDSAVPAVGINSDTAHDHLPFAARTGDAITLVWMRHDTIEALPWLNPKSDLFYATSSDGRAWSAPVKITNEVGNVVNIFPGLYPSHDEEWNLVWLSTKTGSPRVFEIPLVNADRYPLGLMENTLLPAGYSHRISPTSTPDIYVGVWTQGPDGVQDIYYRFFEKL